MRTCAGNIRRNCCCDIRKGDSLLKIDVTFVVLTLGVCSEVEYTENYEGTLLSPRLQLLQCQTRHTVHVGLEKLERLQNMSPIFRCAARLMKETFVKCVNSNNSKLETTKQVLTSTEIRRLLLGRTISLYMQPCCDFRVRSTCVMNGTRNRNTCFTSEVCMHG